MIQSFLDRLCLILRQVYEFLGQLWDTLGGYLSTDTLQNKFPWSIRNLGRVFGLWYWEKRGSTQHEMSRCILKQHCIVLPLQGQLKAQAWTEVLILCTVTTGAKTNYSTPDSSSPSFKKQNQTPQHPELDQERHLQNKLREGHSGNTSMKWRTDLLLGIITETQ